MQVTRIHIPSPMHDTYCSVLRHSDIPISDLTFWHKVLTNYSSPLPNTTLKTDIVTIKTSLINIHTVTIDNGNYITCSVCVINSWRPEWVVCSTDSSQTGLKKDPRPRNPFSWIGYTSLFLVSDEDGTDRVSWKVIYYPSTLHDIPEEQRCKINNLTAYLSSNILLIWK